MSGIITPVLRMPGPFQGSVHACVQDKGNVVAIDSTKPSPAPGVQPGIPSPFNVTCHERNVSIPAIPILTAKWGDQPTRIATSSADSSTPSTSSQTTSGTAHRPGRSRNNGRDDDDDFPFRRERGFGFSLPGRQEDKTSHSYINSQIKEVLKQRQDYFGRAIYRNIADLRENEWLGKFAMNEFHAEYLCKKQSYEDVPETYQGRGDGSKRFRGLFEMYFLSSSYDVEPHNRDLRLLTVLHGFPPSHPLHRIAEEIIARLPSDIQQHFHKARVELIKENICSCRELRFSLSDAGVHDLFLNCLLTEDMYIALLKQSRNGGIKIENIFELCGDYALTIIKELTPDLSALLPFIRHQIQAADASDVSDSHLRSCLFMMMARNSPQFCHLMGVACTLKVISLEDFKYTVIRSGSKSWVTDVVLQMWDLSEDRAAAFVQLVNAPDSASCWPEEANARSLQGVHENILRAIVGKLKLLSSENARYAFLQLATSDCRFEAEVTRLLEKDVSDWLSIILELPLPCILQWLHFVRQSDVEWYEKLVGYLDMPSCEKISNHEQYLETAMTSDLKRLSNRLSWLSLANLDEGFIRTFVERKLLASVPAYIGPIQNAIDEAGRKKYFIRAIQQLLVNAAQYNQQDALPEQVKNALLALTERLFATGQKHFAELTLNSLASGDRAKLDASLDERQATLANLPKTQNAEFWRQMFLTTREALQSLRSSSATSQQEVSRTLAAQPVPTPLPGEFLSAGVSRKRGRDEGGEPPEPKRSKTESAEADSTTEELQSMREIIRQLQEENALLRVNLVRTEQILQRQQEQITEGEKTIGSMLEHQQKLENEKLSCTICTLDYSDTNPSQTFPCGHLICKPCVDKIVYIASTPSDSDDSATSKSPAPDNDIRCPVCKRGCRKVDIKRVYLSV